MNPLIAIVDDEESVRTLICTYVAKDGFDVAPFSSGDALLAEIDRGLKPALFLLDIMMPKMDGFELCAALRARRELIDSPAVFLTAMEESHAYERALEVGIDDLLVKPIRRGELIARVRSLLRYAGGKRALRDAHRSAVLQNAALDAAAKRQRELSAMVVHDLKTPLATLEANLRFAVDAAVPSEVREALVDSLEVSETMARRVATILDLARADAGRLLNDLAPLPLRPELERIVRHEQRRAQRRAVMITSDCPAALSAIADRELLRRMLENLVDNAFRHVTAGAAIVLVAETVGERVTIEVRDSGCGLSEEARNRLFVAFSGEHRDDDDGSHHVGLGLAFCKVAAEAQGGKIEVLDNVPHGTIVRLSLPLA